MSAKAFAKREDVLANNCQAVMTRFNMQQISGIGMFENVDGSIEYHWRTPDEYVRVLVYEEHYHHLAQDTCTGKLLTDDKYNFVKSDGTLDYLPVNS